MRTLRPLLQFESHRTATSRPGQRARLLAVTLLLGVTTLVYVRAVAAAIAGGGTAAGAGWGMVSFAALLNYLLLCVAAMGPFASPVSEEREAGTLPLLVVAGLPLRSLVAGKGVSRLLPAAVLLLTELPLLAGMVGFGGVSWPQLQSIVVLLAGFLIFCWGWGLLLSTLALRTWHASVGMFLVLLLFEWAPWNARVMLNRGIVGPGGLAEVFSVLAKLEPMSVYLVLAGVLDFGTTSKLGVAVNQSWAGLAAAGTAVLISEPWLQRTFRAGPRPVAAGGARRTRRFGRLPHTRAEFRLGVGGWTGLLGRLVCYPAFAMFIAWGLREASTRPPSPLLLMAIPCLVPIAAIDLWFQSGRVIGREVADDTLGSLLMAEARPIRLLTEKGLASITVLAPVILSAAGLWVAWNLSGRPPGPVLSQRFEDAAAELFCASALVVALFALTLRVSLAYPTGGFAIAIGTFVIVSAVVWLGAEILTFLTPLSSDDLPLAVGYFALLAAFVLVMATLLKLEEGE